MLIELKKLGFKVENQKCICVYYDDVEVGIYYADIVVEDVVIVELKASEALAEDHAVQLVNYLKATNIEVSLLLNFGKKPEVKRKVFDNNLK